MTELANPEERNEERNGPLRHEGDDAVRALVVGDEDLRTTLGRLLRQRGIVAETAENGFAALDLLERERGAFDVVLVDVRMDGMTGSQLLQRVKGAAYPVEVLMMTAFADIATAVSAVKAGAHGFLIKPFVSNESVVMEVLNAAQLKRLRERNERLQLELQQRMEQLRSAASAPMPISSAAPFSSPEGPVSQAGPAIAASGSMDDLVGALGLATMGYPEAKKRLLAEFNDAYVGALLRSTTGNMSEAARRSGLDRLNFRRLVRTTTVDVAAVSSRTPPTDEDG